MTTTTNARHRVLSLALLAAAGTMALTACGASGSANGPAAGNIAAPPKASGTASAAAGSAVSSTSSTSSTSSSVTGGGDATSDSYAYKHACTADQLRVKVSYDAQVGVTKRLIAVTDTGSAACGLSYYPVVAVDNSSSIGATSGAAQSIQPAVPGAMA